MTLTQDEILALLFYSTNLEKEVSMAEINEFLSLLQTKSKLVEQFYFFMPMHDDFNEELFKENSENGNFFIKRVNVKSIVAIQDIVLNTIKVNKDKTALRETITEFRSENTVKKTKAIKFSPICRK